MTAALRDSPLLYVFMDVAGADAERELLEGVIGLRVIEVEAHLPHERHGIVKYDAGDVILSLNLSTPGKFRAGASDALVTVLDVAPDGSDAAALRGRGDVEATGEGIRFTDPWGHHFVLRPGALGAGEGPRVAELRLAVDDLAGSVAFYRDRVGLEVLDAGGGTARLGTGSADLVLEQRRAAVDGRALDRRTVLLVFHTPGIEEVREALIADRGLEFDTRRVAYSKIGGTTRFTDPSGHRFCLYEPSEESLGWGSGPKVIEVAARAAAAR